MANLEHQRKINPIDTGVICHPQRVAEHGDLGDSQKGHARTVSLTKTLGWC